jgi:trk system potassium uptake protein TrkA
MHVIVVGCGRVGSEMAANMDNDGHSVAVIDKNKNAFRRLPERWSGRAVHGLGFDRDHLQQAGIEQADALAAVTSGDNSNILTARIARETYEVERVVARIYDPRRALIYQRLGIPTVATVTWTTDQITRRLFPEEATVEWADPSGDLLLVERTLPNGWAGQRLSEAGFSERIRVPALVRAGRPHLVDGDTVGHEGDTLHVMVYKDALDELDEKLGRADDEPGGHP